VSVSAPAGATTLGFVGSATNAYPSSSGTATLTYTDGSTQALTLSMTDWWNATAQGGNQIAATCSYINTTNGQQNQQVHLYYAEVALQAGKAAKSITLPATVSAGQMHIFAMALSGPPYTAKAAPTVITYADGSKDLVVQGDDGHLWHIGTNGSRTGWETSWNWFYGGYDGNVNPSLTVINYADGSKDLVVVGDDGRIWHIGTSGSRTGWDASWSPFSQQMGNTNLSPTLISYADGSMDLVVVGSDQHLWHITTSGSRTGWGTSWNWFYGGGNSNANPSPTLITYADGSKIWWSKGMMGISGISERTARRLAGMPVGTGSMVAAIAMPIPPHGDHLCRRVKRSGSGGQ